MAGEGVDGWVGGWAMAGRSPGAKFPALARRWRELGFRPPQPHQSRAVRARGGCGLVCVCV